MSAKFPNIDNPINFFVLYHRKSNLQKLFTNWDNSNSEAGQVVDRYVGNNQSNRRKKRFSRSVNYLKNITERLRDCTDISVAYKEKHREVENMIVTIRKLYSLIIFLRDQIARNQDNYDTLERLILEIMIAMKGDYHIPEEELARLKAIQKRIADDGVELEKKFRIVSNQILDRLKSADALRNESPKEIGPDFPLNQEGLEFNEATKDRDREEIKPANYIVNKDPRDNDKILKYFEKNDNGKSTGAPFRPDPSPFKYTEADKDNGYYGQYDPANNLDNLNVDNPDIEKNKRYNNIFTKYSQELKELFKEYNEEKRKEILRQIKEQFNEELPDKFLDELKVKSEDDAKKLLSGNNIERGETERLNNKKIMSAMGEKEKKIPISLPTLGDDISENSEISESNENSNNGESSVENSNRNNENNSDDADNADNESSNSNNIESPIQYGSKEYREKFNNPLSKLVNRGQSGGYRKPKKSRKKDKVSYKNKLHKYRSKLRTMSNKYKVAKKLMNKCMNI